MTDPVERRAAFRAVTAALGTIGRMTLGDAAEMSDEQVDRLAAREGCHAAGDHGLRITHDLDLQAAA